MHNIILDTDIFGDPDDLLALLYLLAQPDLNIDLIITNDEYCNQRAALTQKFLNLVHRSKVPVVAGRDIGNRKYFQFSFQSHIPEINTNVIESVKKVISKKDKITYLCIGPQTNLAAFIKENPNYTERLNVIIMGGSLNQEKPCVEHNIRLDIKAAQYVCSNVRAKYILIDHTQNPKTAFKVTHPLYEKLNEMDNQVASMVLENINYFFKNLYPTSYFHDPIAASAINHDFVTFRKKYVTILPDGHLYASPKGNLQFVSSNVEYDSFLSHFTESVANYIEKFESS